MRKCAICGKEAPSYNGVSVYELWACSEEGCEQALLDQVQAEYENRQIFRH
jgi:hypothetical protein